MSADKVVVYRDDAGEWRWKRENTGNHEVDGVSGESFDSHNNAVRAAENANPGVEIEVQP
jgi:uncharacterized protein YegP (UPF0339 family)